MEKVALEKLLDMGGGYVLNFTNQSLQEFVRDVVGKDIWDDKYDYASNSKANRIRAFWREEPNSVVANLLYGFLEYVEETEKDAELWAKCLKIVHRLRADPSIENLDAIEVVASGPVFDALVRSVKDSIRADQPEAALDRLHTYVVKYIRSLCDREGIEIEGKPLQSLFGELRKSLKARGLFQSAITERIFKVSASVLDSFNDVRNNQSLAHDNPLVSKHEAHLILNHVTGLLRFLWEVVDKPALTKTGEYDDSVPF